MDVDYDWVKAQFAEAKVRVGAGKAVIKLLETWETLDLTPSQAKAVVDVFGNIALGHALVLISKEEYWVDARRGSLKVGDVVRVSQSAFQGKEGTLYNGRKGVVTAIRSGDIIIKSNDDKLPELNGVHFAPEKLQKRVK